ncbi:MAG: hypothetical protein QCI82_00185 [Candidatus Thermoplasmatota archaeon]|nr:hypothetical protein [Candidatus Thermoplasmatota archaeon]
MGLSSGDRIILYLGRSDRGRDIDHGFDQKEISQGCCIGRTHVPRSIRPLMEAGLVREEKKRVPGKGRLVKRYRLTVEGSAAMDEIREGLRSMRVSLIGPEGLKNTMDPFSALSLANTYLERMSMVSIMLSQLMSIDSDPIRWDEVIELSLSSPNRSSPIQIPAGWGSVPTPKAPKMYIPVPGDEDRLRRMISSEGMAVVQGVFGSGRRTVTSRVFQAMGRKPIWIARSDNGEPVKLHENFDAIVILEGEGTDPYSLITSSCPGARYDPRGEGWSDDLSSLPLVVIHSGRDPLNAPTLELSPLPFEDFEKALSPLGMKEGTVLAIYEATGGIPLAVRTLLDMDPEDLSITLRGSRDQVVFRVLLMLKKIEKETKP